MPAEFEYDRDWPFDLKSKPCTLRIALCRSCEVMERMAKFDRAVFRAELLYDAARLINEAYDAFLEEFDARERAKEQPNGEQD